MARSVIEHEHFRFETMTPAELETRLDRITNPEKLEAFFWRALEIAAMENSPARRQRFVTLAARAKDKMEGKIFPGHQYTFDFLLSPAAPAEGKFQ